MTKFQRYYKLIYKYPTDIDNTKFETITISYPLKCDFSIIRNVFAQANSGTFSIYNLGISKRSLMYKDVNTTNRKCTVEFYAGYGNKLIQIFKGLVLSCYSSKQGTDNITTIDAIDNDIVGNYVTTTFEAGTSVKEIVDTMVGQMPDTELGSTGELSETISSRLAIAGDCFSVIDKVTGGRAFIDMGKLNVLQDNEVLGDYGIYKIDSSTGLLNTPERYEAQLVATVVFSPEIFVGQLVEITSSTTSNLYYNGQFKVIGIQHSGSISAADSSPVTTKLNLWVGASLPITPTAWKPTTPSKAEQPKNKQQVVKVKGTKKEVLVQNVNLNTIQEVYSYIIQNKQIPRWKITKNISWLEMLGQSYYGNSETKASKGIAPSLEVLSNVYATALKVQEYIDKFYFGKTISINSGWREKRHNAAIGGAKQSQHIYGKAVDIKIAGVNVKQMGANARSMGFWVKDDYGNRIHMDIRNMKITGVANDV